MQIQRIRRQSKYDESKSCDFCNEPMETGYKLYIDDQSSVMVCDKCLEKTRKSKIGFWCEHPIKTPNWE